MDAASIKRMQMLHVLQMWPAECGEETDWYEDS